MKKKDLFISLVLLIALVFSGCAAPGIAEAVNDLTTGEGAELSRALASGANWSVEYRTVTDWGTGFNGELKISNTGKEPISNWTLSFDWAARISSIWNAKLVSGTTGTYVIVPPTWNPTIAPGGSLKIGINGGGPLTGGPMTNVELIGEGVVVKEGYESFDSFTANLKAAFGKPYILNISPIDGSSRYLVSMHYDPTLPRPTLLGMLSSAQFIFTRTKSNLVIVDPSSYKANYQGSYKPEVDCPLMLEGVRLYIGEKVITSKTICFLDEAHPLTSDIDKIYFWIMNDGEWVVRRDSSGQVWLNRELSINYVNHDAFMKGLKAKLPAGFVARSIAIPTLAPPATWTVEVTSIIDTAIPGTLNSLGCTISELGTSTFVEVNVESLKAKYYLKWWNAPQPNGRVLFKAMQLYLAQSGVKSFYLYEALALTAQIELTVVATDGKKFSFVCPLGKKWTAFEDNGRIYLKEGI